MTNLHPMTRLRMERRNTLCMAISDCEPNDAKAIMTAVLGGMQTDGPQHDLLGTARSDAEWWAAIAPPHEIEAYTLAGLRALAPTAISANARLHIMAALWNGLQPEDKRAFISKVTGAKA